MKKDSEQFLEELLNAPSPSGFEQPAAKVFRKRVEGYADEVTGDMLGNSFATLNSKAEFTFLIDGHIDEIGLMVTHIDDKGFLYVTQIGGVDPSLMLGQRVRVLGAKGPVLGVIGRKPIHLMESDERGKKVRIEDLWVDVGANNRKDAEKAVGIGDPIIVDAEYRRLRGDRIVARGCDDRIGAFVVAETIRELSKKKLNIRVVGVASVMEEVGHQGAITSSYQIRPHAGIAVDVGFASDYPKADPKIRGEAKLGKGPILHRGANINPILGAELIDTAKSLKIPYQLFADPRPSGTNAKDIQVSRGGVATALVSVPNRYMHTPVEMISLTDLNLTVKLLVGYLSRHPARKDYRP